MKRWLYIRIASIGGFGIFAAPIMMYGMKDFRWILLGLAGGCLVLFADKYLRD